MRPSLACILSTSFRSNGGGTFGRSFAVLEAEVSQLQTVLAVMRLLANGMRSQKDYSITYSALVRCNFPQ